jgi:hypothetical protein
MSNKNEQGSMDVKQKNGSHILPTLPQVTSNSFNIVLEKPLHKLSSESTAPKSLPSSMHAGFCNTTNPIAAILTSAFISSLPSSAGVTVGQRFCVDAKSWKGIADKGGEDVPRVKLEATHEAALKSVGLDVLKKYKAEQDQRRVGGAERPGTGGLVKDSQEIGGKEPKA